MKLLVKSCQKKRRKENKEYERLNFDSFTNDFPEYFEFDSFANYFTTNSTLRWRSVLNLIHSQTTYKLRIRVWLL